MCSMQCESKASLANKTFENSLHTYLQTFVLSEKEIPGHIFCRIKMDFLLILALVLSLHLLSYFVISCPRPELGRDFLDAKNCRLHDNCTHGKKDVVEQKGRDNHHNHPVNTS